MNKKSRKEMFARVDKEVWSRLQNMLPEESSSNISRILYNTSLLKLESKLRSFDAELTKGLNKRSRKKFDI